MNRLTIEAPLGWGQDGVVFSTSRRSAVKGFRFEPQYRAEILAYKRLRECGVSRAAGFAIPRLFGSHDQMMVIEIEIVNPPYAIDFAASYLDVPPDYPDDILEEADRQRRENFGDDWPAVARLLSELRRIGIHLADVNPRNIAVR